MRDAMSVSRALFVDELNCRKSFSRVATKKSVEEVLQMGLHGKDTLWHFIPREWPTEHYELGCSTMLIGDTDYFLWIHISNDDADLIVKKYKLQSRPCPNTSHSLTSVNTET